MLIGWITEQQAINARRLGKRFKFIGFTVAGEPIHKII